MKGVNSNVHICIVAPEQIPVPPAVWGSVEICIHETACRMARHHRVTVISREHVKFRRITKHGNLTIVRVPTGSRARYLSSVLKVMKGRKFDWIQVDNRPRYAAAIRRLFPHTPISIFLHSLVFVTPPEASLASTNACLSKVDRIVTNSVSMKEELARLFPAQKSKLRKVLLGADLSRFRPPSAEQAASIKRKYKVKNGFNVLFVGRLIPKKGLPVLIKAVHLARRSIPSVRLLVAGAEQSKGYMGRMKQEALKWRVPTVFLGKIPHHKLHPIYWLGDCFVCPSQKLEPFGLVNVEAMGSGIPVIASANGGIKEVIQDGHNGLLVRSYHNAESFAEQIVTLAKNKSMAKRLAGQARKDALRRFNWNIVTKSLLNIYERKISRR